MNDLTFSSYGPISSYRFIKNEKEYTSFLQIHFNDADSVSKVMKDRKEILFNSSAVITKEGWISLTLTEPKVCLSLYVHIQTWY